MTMFFNDVVNLLEDLNAEELAAWIDKGWIKPEKTSESDVFHTTDVARVRLIAECRYQLNLDIDTIDLIVPLLDQVYGLRRELRTLVRAINAQPDDVRQNILDATTYASNDRTA